MPCRSDEKGAAASGIADGGEEEYEEEEERVEDDFSLHQAIRHCQLVREVEDNMLGKTSSSGGSGGHSFASRDVGGEEAPAAKRPKLSEDSYFSDED